MAERKYEKSTMGIVYEYDIDGMAGDGICEGRKIRVDNVTLKNDPAPNHDMYDRLFDIKHKSLLECMFIDYKNKNIIYEHFDTYLRDYSNPKCVLTYKVAYQKLKDQYHSSTDRKDQVYKNETNSPALKYQYISGKHRTIFREMLAFVCYIHSLDLCLNSLSLENLVLQNTTFKFYGIQFISKNDEHESRDFIYVADVIESLLEHSNDLTHIPADFAQFLICLREFKQANNGNNVEDYEYYFKNHIAILPFDMRIPRVRGYGETKKHIDFVASKIKVDDTVLEYRVKKAQMAIALNKMGVKRNWIKERFDSYEWGLVHEVIRGGSYEDQSDRECAGEFLRFGRNLASHLVEKFHNYKSDRSSKDLDLTMMAAIDKEMALFEKEIFNQHLFRFFTNNEELVVA